MTRSRLAGYISTGRALLRILDRYQAEHVLP